jgi:hypothetical protein
MEGGSGLVEEVAATIKEAAAGQRVVVIRLEVGREVTIPKVEIASQMHRLFPGASVEISDGKEGDSVTVKDIEVA